jgi:hypothetical protein
VPADPQYSLVSSLDALALNRCGLETLIDPKDRERKVVEDTTVKALGALDFLPSHAIIDRGRVVGLWEFDVDSRSIAWASFGRKKDKALEAAVEETQAFVRDQLGDARSFSLDSPKSRTKRIEALRAMR